VPRFARQRVYKRHRKQTPVPMDVLAREGAGMGINRWSDIEERKRNETDAKASDEIPEGKKGDTSSRVDASEEPAEDREKHEVVEKLKERES
jgi:hypothetical protein